MKNINQLYSTTKKLASFNSRSTDVEFDFNRLDPLDPLDQLDVNNSVVNNTSSFLDTYSSSSNSFSYQTKVQKNVHLNSNPLSDHTKALKIDSKLNSHLNNEQFKNEADQLSYSSFESSFSKPTKSFNHSKSSFYSRLLSLILIILIIDKSSAAVVNNNFPNNQDSNFLSAFNETISSNSIELIDQKYESTNESIIPTPSSKNRRFVNGKDQLNLQIAGFRLEGERIEIEPDQTTSIFSDHEYTILLYGFNFTNYTNDLLLSITPIKSKRGEDCSVYSKDVYNLSVINDQVAKGTIGFDSGDASKSEFYYICIDYKSQSIHQG